MQRILPETELERKLMSMAAVFIEEHHLLDDLEDIIASDLEIIKQGKPLPTDLQEQMMEEMADYFFRLDLQWGDEIKEDCVAILSDFWGVVDKETALKTIEGIRQQGHRVKFNVLKDCTPKDGNFIKGPQLDKFKQIFKFDFAEKDQIELQDDEFVLLADWMRKTDRFIGECGILGWDIARLVHLARLSYVAGYIDDNEAWGEILKAAPLVEGKFKNWQEYALSFLIGRTFWAGEEDKQVKRICERLLGHPASPWQVCKI